ncbi:transporter substrate-binding domain-containing protein [Alkalilacustris brevis]|uniref:transporter substrate-binding domain-containing protein n=1 Tax=Alkalilacustris brevis TaxID=2026338 RepID=UPI000E0CD505|nr:transporter substrate-binding domain-containing protein [Alkalilacustris brevis]
MTSRLSDILQQGVLRAAIHTSNRALVQVQGDVLKGVSPALAERLARELRVSLRPVVYNGAGAVVADAGKDIWDIAFLAIDPMRANSISFTRPYVVIEATYATRADSPFQDVADVDRKNVTVLTSAGSAHDLYLSKTLCHAQLERADKSPPSLEQFRNGRGDVVSGVRESLQREFGNDDAFRILPGVLTNVEQAMVLPGAANPLISELDAFVARAIDDGFVARHLNREGK